jgi:hypothetical protein
VAKNYVIWWHSKYIDEIDRSATTIEDILDKASKTLLHLEDLKKLEKAGKIKVKATGSLNPIYINILDKSIESEVVKNPLVEVIDEERIDIY